MIKTVSELKAGEVYTVFTGYGAGSLFKFVGPVDEKRIIEVCASEYGLSKQESMSYITLHDSWYEAEWLEDIGGEATSGQPTFHFGEAEVEVKNEQSN